MPTIQSSWLAGQLRNVEQVRRGDRPLRLLFPRVPAEAVHPTFRWPGLLTLVACWFAGCATAPRPDSAVDHSTAVAQIQSRLGEVFDAAARKDFDRLDSYHLYGPKFTKFSPPPGGREDAATARKGEHDGLGAITNLSMHADQLQIDVFGDVAIATLILDSNYQIGGSTRQSQARGTLVFVKEHKQWKITHEHLSPFQPNR